MEASEYHRKTTDLGVLKSGWTCTPLTTCATLWKSLDLSGPQESYTRTEDNNVWGQLRVSCCTVVTFVNNEYLENGCVMCIQEAAQVRSIELDEQPQWEPTHVTTTQRKN